jgi:hypothetical protein
LVVVAGLQPAQALISSLSSAFVFKSSEPIVCGRASGRCSFRIPYGPGVSHRQLKVFVSTLPGVLLGADLKAGEAPCAGATLLWRRVWSRKMKKRLRRRLLRSVLSRQLEVARR